MIEFLAIDKISNSNEYDKGILFEKLVQKLVKACGYKNVELRRKQRSLEYDVHAISNLGNTTLVGEAKAIQKKVSDELFKFVAKMLIDWNANKSTLGFFISTSELTAETTDYFNAVSSIYNLQVLAGEISILNKLAETAGYLNINQIGALATEKYGGKANECIFLVTDRGEFYIQLICKDELTVANSFCVFDHKGNEIQDESFLAYVNKMLANLKDLTPLFINRKNHKNYEFDSKKIDQGFISMVQGKGWFDYKLPASPEYFIRERFNN